MITSGGTIDIYSNYVEGSTPSGNAFTEIGPSGYNGNGLFTIAPVPLPASLWMMILGLGGLGTVAVRKATT